MIRAVQAEKPDLCFYLGDGENDLRLLQKRFPLYMPVAFDAGIGSSSLYIL